MPKKKSTRKSKSGFWNNVKKEFNRSPISTISSIFTGLVAFFVIIIAIISIMIGGIPPPFDSLFRPAPEIPHTITVELNPEFFDGNQIVDYNVEFCNQINSSPVNEIRIYQNNEFEDLQCNPKYGWELIYVPEWRDTLSGENIAMCWYYASESPVNFYIYPGRCETFNFKAKSPEIGCDISWRFETRDIYHNFRYTFDSVSTNDCIT